MITLSKILKQFISIILFAIIVFEELFWAAFESISKFFARFEIVKRIEGYVLKMSPFWCLLLFLIPVLIIQPPELFGLWLIAKGNIISGSTLFFGAKIIGTFFAARLFLITKHKLLQIYWFAMFYYVFTDWKDSIKNAIHSTEFYRNYLKYKTFAKVLIYNFKIKYKRFSRTQ